MDHFLCLNNSTCGDESLKTTSWLKDNCKYPHFHQNVPVSMGLEGLDLSCTMVGVFHFFSQPNFFTDASRTSWNNCLLPFFLSEWKLSTSLPAYLLFLSILPGLKGNYPVIYSDAQNSASHKISLFDSCFKPMFSSRAWAHFLEWHSILISRLQVMRNWPHPGADFAKRGYENSSQCCRRGCTSTPKSSAQPWQAGHTAGAAAGNYFNP